MKREFPLFVFFIVMASCIISCTHERHHRDPHKKYKVIDEDSAHKVDIDDHMHDYQPH